MGYAFLTLVLESAALASGITRAPKPMVLAEGTAPALLHDNRRGPRHLFAAYFLDRSRLSVCYSLARHCRATDGD
jgi:hypothetical protein